jgi:hypothetical protein
MQTRHEKKQIGYSRDERSVHGESEKAQRVGSEHRTLTRRELPKNMLRLDTDGAEAATTKVRGASRKGWTKRPEMSLGKYLAGKRMRRARP